MTPFKILAFSCLIVVQLNSAMEQSVYVPTAPDETNPLALALVAGSPLHEEGQALAQAPIEPSVDVLASNKTNPLALAVVPGSPEYNAHIAVGPQSPAASISLEAGPELIEPIANSLQFAENKQSGKILAFAKKRPIVAGIVLLAALDVAQASARTVFAFCNDKTIRNAGFKEQFTGFTDKLITKRALIALWAQRLRLF